MTFHQEADTFSLTMTLMDVKLVVVLEDYVDWVIYKKEFTQDDIGNDIHRKMDLHDVYNVVNQTRKVSSKEFEKKYGFEKIKPYQFKSTIMF